MQLDLLNVLLAYAMNTKLSGILCDSPDEFLVDSVGGTRAECGREISTGQNWISCVFRSDF